MTDLCAAFGVARSGYHRWRTAPPCALKQMDVQLSEQLRTLHRQSRGTYGRPRLWAALRQSGQRHSPKRIGRLLRALGLRGVQRGRFTPQTTNSRHAQLKAPNRLLNRPRTTAHNQVWVADLTFVPTQEGWLYVAAVLDRHSRRLLGLACAGRMDAELPATALRQALLRRQGLRRPQEELLHHSDQGAQYASTSYQNLLVGQGLTPSMSRPANCYDNAHMESFWATLKTEALAGRTFATRAQAQLAIFEYVETFYNRVRLHSALGYQSPVDFENQAQ
ncbi:MAG: IS3 family transposase [Chthoniobacteraceae bacterium]